MFILGCPESTPAPPPPPQFWNSITRDSYCNSRLLIFWPKMRNEPNQNTDTQLNILNLYWYLSKCNIKTRYCLHWYENLKQSNKYKLLEMHKNFVYALYVHLINSIIWRKFHRTGSSVFGLHAFTYCLRITYRCYILHRYYTDLLKKNPDGIFHPPFIASLAH